MAQVNAGRVRFVSKGEYNNETQYYIFDLVNYNGSSYYAKENTIGILPTNTTKWQLVAEKGNIGPVGPQGETGNGIVSVVKTSTSVLTDTYTITYTNGNTSTFTVTNGEDGEVTQEQLDKVIKDLEYLKTTNNALPKVEGEGTDITLNDTADSPLSLEFKVSDSTQESTRGVQLFDKNNVNVLNAFFSSDGKRITASNNAKILYIACDPNTTYTVSKISSARFRLLTTETVPTINVVGIDYLEGAPETITILTITTSSNANYLCVYYYLNGTDTLTEQEVLDSIQIEEGSTATDYEPYTGGQPAPNPSYPYPVHVVKGDNEVVIQGRNLFDGVVESGNYNIMTSEKQLYPLNLGVKNLFDKDNITTRLGYIKNNNGIDTADTGFGYITSFINVKPNTDYVLFGQIVDTQTQSRIYFYDESQNWISRSDGFGNGNNELRFTTLNNCYYIQFQFNKNVFDKNTLQLEEGNTAHSYSPYGQTPIEMCKISTYADELFKNVSECEYYDESLEIGKWYKLGKIAKIDSYNGETITTQYMSTTGGLDTGSTVYYVLATPTKTLLLDTLQEQLDNILYAMAYQDQTNISQINEDRPFVINASTVKDMKTLEDRITALEESITL